VAADRPEIVLPQVELLVQYGVRPRDLDRVMASLGFSVFPRTLEEATAILQKHVSFSKREKSVARVSLRARLADAIPHNDRLEGKPPEEFSRPRDGASSFLHLQSVSHVYPGNASAVANVTLSIEEGEFIALLGQNGSGKTTLAKIMSGLLTPTQGRVLLRGEALSRLPLHTVAQEISYVFQNPDHQLFAATVEEEVAFGPRNVGLTPAEVEARVHEALAAVGLSALRTEDPFLLGRGARQRLAVAALLALRPRLLILDEPTTGLDFPEQQRMMQLLRRLHEEGRTIIIITHTPWVAAEYARRVLLMAHGQLLWDGEVRDLCARPELCASAAFRPPDVTLLGAYYGFTPLSVEEFVVWSKKQQDPARPTERTGLRLTSTSS
jgi:energy-coupling factor transport system ATP-binding protein